MKNTRKLLLLVFVALFMFFFAGTAYAASKIMVPTVLENTYVYDQGDFINDDVEKEVNNLLDQLEEKTTIEFAVITIPSLNDDTIENYAYELAKTLGIGKKEKSNGILLLISKSDSRVRLEIGNGLQGILTDSVSGRILDEFFVPYRSEGNYEEATSKTVQAVINKIAESEEYNFEIEGLDKEVQVSPEYTTFEVVLYTILIIIIIIGYIWAASNGYVSGRFYGGGGSSGGGFSGFGGGGFSGGGASR